MFELFKKTSCKGLEQWIDCNFKPQPNRPEITWQDKEQNWKTKEEFEKILSKSSSMNFICFPLEEEMRKNMRQETQWRRILLISAINLSLGGCKQSNSMFGDKKNFSFRFAQ